MKRHSIDRCSMRTAEDVPLEQRRKSVKKVDVNVNSNNCYIGFYATHQRHPSRSFAAQPKASARLGPEVPTG
jgi:hypothetical protein